MAVCFLICSETNISIKLCISCKKYFNIFPLCSSPSNLKEASPHLLGFNIEMIRFVSLLLKNPFTLVDSEWDFVMCSILAWLEVSDNCLNAQNNIFWCLHRNLVLQIFSPLNPLGGSFCPLQSKIYCKKLLNAFK